MTALSDDRTAFRAPEALGRFVRSGGSLGFGKLAVVSELEAEVDYFVSIAVTFRERVSLRALQFATPSRQTRCYFQDADRRWRTGRVESADRGDFRVALPNRRGAVVREQDLFVRCNRPMEDPTEVLALLGQETPFLSERRQAFVRQVALQRSLSCGITALPSASIELHAHQFNAARRVLEDPIPRYLLADEVGLGKTIEAGIVIRQTLLDDEEATALVLAPGPLVEQWRAELEERFHLNALGGRVDVEAIDDVANFVSGRGRGRTTLSLLVIDEAHHVASAAASAEKSRRAVFDACRELAHRTPRLLLLSATPVLDNERDFLAMLHLLDPETHRLDDVEAFRRRVESRQEIGRCLLAFREDSLPLVLRRQIPRMRELFQGDSRLEHLLAALEGRLNTDGVDARKAAIREIRAHVGETYRLHRRLVRNRRASIDPELLASRSGVGKNGGLSREWDLDDDAADVLIAIDEWRERAQRSLEAPGTSAARRDELARLHRILLFASGSVPGVLASIIGARRSGRKSASLRRDLDELEARAVTGTPTFPGESEHLERLATLLARPTEGRIETLVQVLEGVRRRSPLGQPRKCLIFSGYTSAAETLHLRLSKDLGTRAVASHIAGLSGTRIDDEVRRFRQDRACFVLICDRSGEEGRNLQLVDLIVHFDLPWSPNRVEQRIGRIDRIGRLATLESIVFLGPAVEESPHIAWYEFLEEGLSVFRRSIASLQFFVDRQLPILERLLFEEGGAGVAAQRETIGPEIEREQIRLEEQCALDEVDVGDGTAAGSLGALALHDLADTSIRHDIEGYLTQALGFKGTAVRDDEFTYSYTERTLIPQEVLVDRFGAHLRDPFVYRRQVAVRSPRSSLMRIGTGLVDALAAHARADEGGRAYAMWRRDPSLSDREGEEWIGFAFRWLIEADTFAAEAELGRSHGAMADPRAIRRRADGLFPPLWEVVFVDATSLTEVTNQSIAAILGRSYVSVEKGGSDLNLAKARVSVIVDLVGADRFPTMCRSARDVARRTLAARLRVQDECTRRAERAEMDLRQRVECLRARRERGLGSARENAAVRETERMEEAVGTALVCGIRAPRMHLDSVGFYILSSRSAPYGQLPHPGTQL